MTAIALILMAISLDLKDAPLTDALKQIEQQSGLQLAYEQKVVENAEPVTLKVEGVPAGEVLRRILRPRGLEFIQTSDTMAAIVPAESDMGMAKAAGRALRTFARLAEKLEAAEQHGDEVRVPGWTDADDRALAEGLTDILSAAVYFGITRRVGEEDKTQRTEQLLAMMTGYDRDVRAGMTASVGARRVEEAPPEFADRLNHAATAMTKDADPVVRGCGLFALAYMIRISFANGGGLPLVARTVADAKNDPAREVRFAAAFARVAGRFSESTQSTLEKLRSDESAAVRWASGAARLEYNRPHVSPGALRKDAVGLLTDKNPVVRPLGLFFLWGSHKEDISEMHEVLKMADMDKDPWLRLWAETILPLTGPNMAFLARINVLSFSRRRRRALGLAASSFGFRAMEMHGRAALQAGDESAAPDLTAIAKLSDAPHLPARLLGIFVNGMLRDEDAEARILRALRSDDEMDRIAGLLACCAWRKRQDGLLPHELQKAVRPAFHAPTFAESAIATDIIGKMLPFDDALAIFREKALREPESVTTRLLLRAMTRHRDVRSGNDETRTERQIMLWDAVHDSRDASLQTFFRRRVGWHITGNRALMLCMIYGLEPRAFLGLVPIREYGWYLRSKEPNELLRAILDRVGQMYGGPDPAVRVLALKAMSNFLTHDFTFGGRSELKKQALEQTGKMLDRCFADGADDDLAGGGLALLTAFTSERYGPRGRRWISWRGAPPGLVEAAVRALGYANDETHGPAAALLLYNMFMTDKQAGIRDYPELVNAMDAARGKIMKKGTPEDQVVVLCAVAMAQEEATARLAVAELEQRIMKSAVPADLQKRVLASFQRRPPLISLGFKAYLMKRLSNPEEPAFIRREALRVLGRCPDQMGLLIDTLTEVAKAERPTFGFASELSPFVENEIRRLKDEGKPLPEWVDKAAALGFILARDTNQTTNQRRDALRFHAAAAGENAAETVEAFVLDDKAEINLRTTAARLLERVCPETKVYRALAAKYDMLPLRLRNVLAIPASRLARAPGAKAFMIEFRQDKQARREQARRSSLLH